MQCRTDGERWVPELQLLGERSNNTNKSAMERSSPQLKRLTFPRVEVDVKQQVFSNTAGECVYPCNSCGEQLGGVCKVGDALASYNPAVSLLGHSIELWFSNSAMKDHFVKLVVSCGSPLLKT